MSQQPGILSTSDIPSRRKSSLSIHYKFFEGSHVNDVVMTSSRKESASQESLIDQLKETCKELDNGIRVAKARKEVLEVLICSLEKEEMEKAAKNSDTKAQSSGNSESSDGSEGEGEDCEDYEAVMSDVLDYGLLKSSLDLFIISAITAVYNDDVYRCEKGCLIWCTGVDVEADVRMTFWLVQISYVPAGVQEHVHAGLFQNSIYNAMASDIGCTCWSLNERHVHAGLFQDVIHKVMASDMVVPVGSYKRNYWIMQDFSRMSDPMS
ncbi:hypothetical protein KIW84_056982 [Lathyrus oleraceus]|uniref:Uncharacterized protein n=1 Tax=Pisum sativum TaxID=3888 RepID=A0A9D4X1Y8_PEA|nr:hypothetical protein KIW84_056982 [Pisum sativum]